ncbi:MAG: alpha/beta hydrolase [Sphingobium sp.]
MNDVPLHPQMQVVADAMAAAPPLWSLDPDIARAAIDAMEGLDVGGPDADREENHVAHGQQGDVPLILVAPHRPIGVILYFHGGGWVLGNARQMLPVARHLVAESGCAVVLIDYRLAPEHPYPAALEDGETALAWCRESLPNLIGANLPLILAGDSAGANIATVLTGRAVRRGERIEGQYLAYPVADCDFATASYERFAEGPMLDRRTMLWFWDHYTGAQSDRRLAELSPLRADDLSTLPPAILVHAGHDPLLSEGLAYGEALRNAGVAVATRLFADMAHGFATMPVAIEGARDALAFAGAEIRRLIQN